MTRAARARRLIIVAETLRGGLGGVVRDQVAWFERAGWSVAVAAPADDESGPVDGRFHPLAIPTSARQLPAMARAARDLRRLLRIESPDVIHCHGLRSFAVTRLSSRQRPYVTLHGTGMVPSDPVGYGLLRRLGLRITPGLAAGAFNAERERRAGWTFMAHASPRLVHLERLPFPDAQSEPLFLWLGRLSEQKRPDIFVDAITAAAHTRPVRAVIAGDGPLLPDIRRRIARLQAPVELLGHTEDVSDVLARSWALVLFSRFEALTFSVQEAMWSGRAVIGSPLPGIRWLLGDTGLVASDVPQATAAILTLADHAIAERRGIASADHIRELIVPGAPWPAVESAYQARLDGSR